MFCSRLRARPFLGRLRQTKPACATRRSFNGQSNQSGYEYSQHPVRVIGPTIWSAAAIGTIYFTCAAYDVYQDFKMFPSDMRNELTSDDFEIAEKFRLAQDVARNAYFSRGPFVAGSPSVVWDGLGGSTKVIAGIALANTAIMGASKLPWPAAQQWWFSLAHTPGYPWFKNRQLFTHMFGHTGVFHLAMNMLGLMNFGHSLGSGQPFGTSGSHFLAFYLSAGIVSSLGAHFSALVFKSHRFTPGMGASGAIFAVFSAWTMTHQNSHLRIFPFPKVFAARELLEWEVAFEVLGLLGLWKALRLPINWGHAAHLGGLGAGVAYITYAGKGQIWAPTRRAAYRTLKSLRMI